MRPINRSPRLAVANLVDFIDKVWENRFWPPRRPKADKSRSKLTVIFRFNQKKKKAKQKKPFLKKGKGRSSPFSPVEKLKIKQKTYLWVRAALLHETTAARNLWATVLILFLSSGLIVTITVGSNLNAHCTAIIFSCLLLFFFTIK